MSLSTNEVMVLATKAAAGAGAPPAQAAAFGAAAVAHLGSGHSVGALNAALDALPEGPIIDLPLAIARVCEAADEGRAEALLDTADIALSQSYVASLPFHAVLSGEAVLTLDLNTPAARKSPPRLPLDGETYAQWAALAARRLVPESDASRLSGAGAGLSDND